MNEAIKTHARNKGVKLWELADRYGVTDATFSRRLRKEFSQEEVAKATAYINEIADEKNGGRTA